MEIIAILLIWIVFLIIRAAFRVGSKTLEVGVESGCEYIAGRASGDEHDKALRSAALKGLAVALQRRAGVSDKTIKPIPDEKKRKVGIKGSKPLIAYGAMDSFACCCNCRDKVYCFQSLSGDLLFLNSLLRPGMVHKCHSGSVSESSSISEPEHLWMLFHFVGLGRHRVKGRFIQGNELGEVREFEVLRNDGSNWSHFWRYEPVFILSRGEGFFRIESVTLQSGRLIVLALELALKQDCL
ncbi:hypothetical protein [Neptunomonas phycophila]|uniref:hypothetical protein n=1 Tax=Neptunomonas phycophila TaxID=1572645 RepID=UPI001BE95369|nr:hypothetical protein [Neptunomonas phycophila]MBT3144675.1 hypothetical protein [Neptunomonas phycophila]